MSTLTFSNSTFSKAPATTAAAPVSAPKKSFGQRFLAAMMASRQRQAEIAIRRARAMTGDRNTNIDYAMLPFRSE